MKEIITTFARAALGRYAHYFGLDARPVELVIKPLFKLQQRLRQLHAKHQSIIHRNFSEVERLYAENNSRAASLRKAERVLRNVSELLGE